MLEKAAKMFWIFWLVPAMAPAEKDHSPDTLTPLDGQIDHPGIGGVISAVLNRESKEPLNRRREARDLFSW